MIYNSYLVTFARNVLSYTLYILLCATGGSCPNNDAVTCLVNPCDTATCSDERATCVPSYCGGCNAVFYDYTGQNEAKCQRMS